jgi:hypothetical protein
MIEKAAKREKPTRASELVIMLRAPTTSKLFANPVAMVAHHNNHINLPLLSKLDSPINKDNVSLHRICIVDNTCHQQRIRLAIASDQILFDIDCIHSKTPPSLLVWQGWR